ncbi:SDR family NAD(P)-dependent oxidoreductase, partial [Vibrio cincinnatiensis]|uniref:SDR family NAD(P)-dependent oxidoreductase n=1 Tax=Vibrio cincinnatiensis TaxID=675 RepID=UPI001EDE9D50
MNINGALVLITSAGSSLGSTLAVHFAQLGAKIILCDTNQHELIKSWKRCQSVAKDAHYYILADHSLASIDQLFTHIETYPPHDPTGRFSFNVRSSREEVSRYQ